MKYCHFLFCVTPLTLSLSVPPAVQCSCWIDSVMSWWQRCLTGVWLVMRRYDTLVLNFHNMMLRLMSFLWQFLASFHVFIGELNGNDGKKFYLAILSANIGLSHMYLYQQNILQYVLILKQFFKFRKNAWTSDLKWCSYEVCPAEGSSFFNN